MNILNAASHIAPTRQYRDNPTAQLVKDSVTQYKLYPHRIDDAIKLVYRELGLWAEHMPRTGDLPEWKAFLPRARAEWAPHLQKRLDQLADADTEHIPRTCEPITAAAHAHGLTRHTGLSVAAARIATFCDPGTATAETIRELFHTHRHAPTAAIVNLVYGDYPGATATAAGFDYDTRRIALLRLFANTPKETA